MKLTKRQREILQKLYDGYYTTSAGTLGHVILVKGNDSTVITSKSTNLLIVKGLIDSVQVGLHSSGYRLTNAGIEYIENQKQSK